MMAPSTKEKKIEALVKKIVFLEEYEKTLKKHRKTIDKKIYKKLKDSLEKTKKKAEKEIAKYSKR
ncbi:MAG: hypothetical protein J7K73_02330 [Nanoarchaeota archaeon]|nr:hypothetical protein [Nanoarchaeota archaeon]